MKNYLNIKKIIFRGVAHGLIEKRNWYRYGLAGTYLKRCHNQKDKFLQKTAGIHEMWVLAFEPKLKRQSNEWGTEVRHVYRNFDRNSRSSTNSSILLGGCGSYTCCACRTISQRKLVLMISTTNLHPAMRRKRSQFFQNDLPITLKDNSHWKSQATSLPYCDGGYL